MNFLRILEKDKTYVMNYIITLTFFIVLFNTGCTKFINEKPRKSEIVPVTLDELRSLLDNAQDKVNGSGCGTFAELIADNFYITQAIWEANASRNNLVANSLAQNYIWRSDAIPFPDGWFKPYEGPIYYANIVLDHMDDITRTAGDEAIFKDIRGACLFYRAFAFQQLAQLYCKPYSKENLTAPGIVLRMTSNVSAKSVRSSVEDTYKTIIADLKSAVELLPDKAIFPTRPTKNAAYAALARTYLSMREYAKAQEYALKSYEINKILLDFNTLIPVQSPPVKTFNEEVIFHNYSPLISFWSPNTHRVDSNLCLSYADGDLRKQVFLRSGTGANVNTFSFQGSYHGNLGPSNVFDGLANDEIYLILSECYAREGNVEISMKYLNDLLITRWDKGTDYSPVIAVDSKDALEKVLAEREKELLFRGLRWSDIRRLNLEGANLTLERKIGDAYFRLPPNDDRSIMLIPWEEVNRSSIQQNIR